MGILPIAMETGHPNHSETTRVPPYQQTKNHQTHRRRPEHIPKNQNRMACYPGFQIPLPTQRPHVWRQKIQYPPRCPTNPNPPR